MIWSILALGGIIFWGLTILAVIVAASGLASNKLSVAWWTTVAYTAVILLFSNFSFQEYLPKSTSEALMYVGGFIVAGAVWAIAKWWLLLLKIRKHYDQFRAEHFRSNGITEIDVNDRDAFLSKATRYVEGKLNLDFNRLPPAVTEFKGLITTWILLWPLSVIGTVVGDLPRLVANSVWTAIRGFMQSISNSMFGRYSEFNKID